MVMITTQTAAKLDHGIPTAMLQRLVIRRVTNDYELQPRELEGLVGVSKRMGSCFVGWIRYQLDQQDHRHTRPHKHQYQYNKKKRALSAGNFSQTYYYHLHLARHLAGRP